MKTLSKILLIVLTLTLALSVCGCSQVKSVVRDIPRAIELVNDISAVTQISDPELASAEAEKLIHPKSELDADKVVEQVLADDDIKALGLTSITLDQVVVGSMSTPEFKFSDPDLGGNVYVVTVAITVAGHPLHVELNLLSDDSGMGLHSFDITK